MKKILGIRRYLTMFSALVLITLLSLSSYKIWDHYYFQPDLTIVGFVNLADGLGRQSLELINTFKDDVSISFVPTREGKFEDVPKQLKDIVLKKRKKAGKVVLFEDLLWVPGTNYYKKLVKLFEENPEDQIRIAYSMFESTKIPPTWVSILNSYFDAVVVPDKFLIDVYQNSGVLIPVFELPLGLNLNSFYAQPLKKKSKTPFIYANLSVCSDRKNQITLIKAFAKAFGNNPDVLLRINCRYGEDNISSALTKEIASLGLNNIIYTRLPLNKDEYLSLFKSVDCYVSLSKGEGFSIQPREAMALGIPVIATDNTAQTTICESLLVKRVHSPKKEPAIYPWGEYYGDSFNCEVDEAKEALLEVYRNYDKYIKNAEKARLWVQKYNFSSLKPFYFSLVKPKKVILGNINSITTEGIITDSPKLHAKYLKLISSN